MNEMQSSSPNDLQTEPSSLLQSVTEDEESINTSSPECSLSSYRPERRKQRRNPSVLVQWIEEHPYNPYPTKQEKQQLAVMSGMTLRQLNDWFANARRNIKKLGFELWRKKRNGLPNQRIFPHNSAQLNTIPPNVVAGSGDFNCRILSQPPCAGLPPLYGSGVPLGPNGGGGGGGGMVQTLTSSPQPPQPYTTRLNPPFPGTGWFAPTGPLFRPGPSLPTLSPPCSCTMCKTNLMSGVTTVFSSPNQQPKTASLPLQSIPWSTGSLGGSHTFNYGQRDDTWNSNGTPDSCPDLPLALPINMGLTSKDETVSSSNGLTDNSGISQVDSHH